MGKDTGFKEFERKTPAYEPAEERIRHWREFTIPLAQEEVEIQGARCMNCGVPFCHPGCPLGNVIPDFNDHAYQGKWRRALKALIEGHEHATGSERAQRILATWEVQLRKFIKVMPRDYKRALAELAAETVAVA